jgi:hypothetical protein
MSDELSICNTIHNDILDEILNEYNSRNIYLSKDIISKQCINAEILHRFIIRRIRACCKGIIEFYKDNEYDSIYEQDKKLLEILSSVIEQ